MTFILSKYLVPHYSFDRVIELTPDRLKEMGIRNLLLDVDCTLKAYGEKDVSAEVRAWLDDLKRAEIGLCLISNGRGGRISQFAATIELPWFAPAFKPSPRGCRKAIQQYGFEPNETAMVGDQLFSDILAGKRARLITILIKPIRPQDEPWFARIKRPFEKLVFWLCRKHPE